MTPRKPPLTKPRAPKTLWHHFAFLCRTAKGQEWRFFRQRSLFQALKQAEFKADCLEVVKTVEISEAEYKTALERSPTAHNRGRTAI